VPRYRAQTDVSAHHVREYPSLTLAGDQNGTEAGNASVVYEDGSQRSNRRVPSAVRGGLDGDVPARAIIEEQDRLIAEKSGIPAVPVKSIHRSDSRKPDEATRSSRYLAASD
jgi:hypothetical protein